MTPRWLLFAGAPFLALNVNAALAVEQAQTCVLIKHHDEKTATKSGNIDIIMQALGGASSIAVLVIGGKVHWLIKAAAVAGVANMIWNVDKAYSETEQSSGDKDTQVCVTPNVSGQLPTTVTIGTPNTTTEPIKELHSFLSSQSGQRKWEDLAAITADDLTQLYKPKPGTLDWGSKLAALPQIPLPADRTAIFSPDSNAGILSLGSNTDFSQSPLVMAPQWRAPSEVEVARRKATEAG